MYKLICRLTYVPAWASMRAFSYTYLDMQACGCKCVHKHVYAYRRLDMRTQAYTCRLKFILGSHVVVDPLPSSVGIWILWVDNRLGTPSDYHLCCYAMESFYCSCNVRSLLIGVLKTFLPRILSIRRLVSNPWRKHT